jgi:outer membrane protein
MNKTTPMIHFKKYALILILLAGAMQMGAQESSNTNFSLQQALEYAMKNSPNQLNAELDLKNAEYRKKEITGSGLPQITGSIDIKDYINIPTSLLPGQIFGGAPGTFIPVKFGTKYNSTVGLNASQLLFSSDYIFALKASEEFLNLSRININRSRSEVISQVSRAYYAVLIANDRMKLLDANIVRLKKMLDDTKAMNQQGFVELIDVERIEVTYNNLVSEREKVARLVDLAKSALKFQMGYKISDPIELTDNLSSITETPEELSLSKIDISKRPDFQLLNTQQTMLDLDVKRQKWSYLPTLAAYFAHQYNAQRQTFNLLQFDDTDPNKQWFKVTLIGATMNLTIFNGFQRSNRYQQAKVASAKNLNTLKSLSLGAELEATSAVIMYSNAVTSLAVQKKNMELAQHVVDVVQKKFQAGVGSNAEIINAETSLKEAQTNYYNALYDMIVSKIDYQKATGNLYK